MGYALSTEELMQKFGEIYLEVISHKGNTRITCIRRVFDDAVVAYNIVEFQYEGIVMLGQTFHDEIILGKMLGETIKKSGVPHERNVSEPLLSSVNPEVASLFNTKKSTCVSRKVDYMIKGVPYASITEFYNPEFTPVGEEKFC